MRRLCVCSRLPLHSTMKTLHIWIENQHCKSRITFSFLSLSLLFSIFVSGHKTCTSTLDEQNWTLRILHDIICVCVFSCLPNVAQSEKYYASIYRMTDLQRIFGFWAICLPRWCLSATWLWNLVTFPAFMVFSSVAFGFRASCQTQGLI